MVWITLQSRQFKWKKVNVPKLKGSGTYAMSIFYSNPNHRETFFKFDTVQDIEKQEHMCQLFSCSLQYLDQSSVVIKNVMGVAHNCKIMGRAKGQGGETACPPYSWMADMEIREGNKWRHERGNPPISKKLILAETADLRNNFKVAWSTEGGSTSDKFRIGGGSRGVIFNVTGRKLFCTRYKHCNQN